MAAKKPTVAVIGASSDRRKFGNKSVRAHAMRGYDVYPVHPTEKEVEGLKVYAKIEDVPGHLDRISVYLPPSVGLTVIEAIAAKGADEVWLNPGAGGPTLVAKAKALGLNVIEGCSIVDVGVSPSSLADE